MLQDEAALAVGLAEHNGDAGFAFNLRCDHRERIIGQLVEQHVAQAVVAHHAHQTNLPAQHGHGHGLVQGVAAHEQLYVIHARGFRGKNPLVHSADQQINHLHAHGEHIKSTHKITPVLNSIRKTGQNASSGFCTESIQSYYKAKAV